MKAIIEYVPKTKREAIRDAYRDDDGYWISLKEGWEASNTDSGCRTIHEDTIAELKYQIAGIRRKENNTMAKTSIINVEIREELNTAYVTYSTGTEKLYPANKLPKTVQAWLDVKAEEEKREEFLSKREAANLKRDSGMDVIEYSEWNGKEVALTEEELAWFHSVADKCKAATGCTVPITAFNNELCFDRDGKEALGTCWTDNPDNPLDGETTITVDTWFIHEKYRNKIGELPMLTDATLESVICHEIAHLYVWEHGDDHDRKTQELLEMVEAYGEAVEEPVRKQYASNTQAGLPAVAQKPELTVPDNSMGAAEAVAFGVMMAMTVMFWGIVGMIQILMVGIEVLWTLARPRVVRFARATVRSLPTVTTKKGLAVAVRVLPVLVGIMAII